MAMNAPPAPDSSAAQIAARIDRLPASATLWRLVGLLALGGFFELYDLFQTAYISPGLIADGIFAKGGDGAFGMSDQAAFAAATFLGLFVGAALLSPFADRFGRRLVFTFALVWYTAATVAMGLQSTATAVIVLRFVVGIGLGIELVTIDTYLSELVPRHMRSAAFAFAFFVQFLAVPTVALTAWLLVPHAPLGMSGWRWVVLLSGVFALAIWWLRSRLPESARWLATQGRNDEADAVLVQLEARCVRDIGAPLPEPQLATVVPAAQVKASALWQAPYRGRIGMLVVFHVFQAIGFFGFGNWLPALIAAQGTGVTKSLGYSFAISLAYPLAPLLLLRFAQRWENKSQITASALGAVLFGVLFSLQHDAIGMVLCGAMIAFCNAWMSFAYHGYQAELFPTGLRARAVGFCYSFSRLSTAVSSVLIGWLLAQVGSHGVLAFIVISMSIVASVIAVFGPRTRNRALEEIAG
ncbi:MFS transporter [Xanthomonas vesicatoria]|uniref:MFS transporter n=1 Tax=Xanthomonas vesicatoria TaxID=56460 RepID=A0AAJ0N512_9XANT|nr:MFS transporter [Xanthomonas vesicatoria]APO93620.1 MFS transporter [Xanthomonas vesicatoria]KHM94906.1 MFS transporter [Xanthomonas vesicatoria]KHM96088.1 MFS transporter [Xanthomonas vesicatoria]MCC8616858.1 MFS transporter [Xanthomonas vesicatoria]MCC8624762.1 MFS transporter [Xanthomonas vesicatoria]